MAFSRRRAKRGRPRKDVEHQHIVELAAAVEIVLGFGQQRARDLVIAFLEAQQVTPTRLPRGARKALLPGSTLVGYELPLRLGKAEISKVRTPSFENRAEVIRRKDLKPRPAVVAVYVDLLRAIIRNDTEAIVEATWRLKLVK